MSKRTALYRRGTRHRSFVITRAGRLKAITGNLFRGLALLALAATPWVYVALNSDILYALGAAFFAVPAAWQHIRSLRATARSWGGRRRPVDVPAPARAAVEDLCRTFGLQQRRIRYLVAGPNTRLHPSFAAMASGLDGAVLMLNTQLLAQADVATPGDQNDDEVRAIIAHELSHWYSWDSLLGGFTAAANVIALCGGLLAGGLAALDLLPTAAFGLLAIPVTVHLSGRALSRGAEMRADLRAAKVTGSPHALASALVTHIGQERRTWRTILSTHPATADRIRALTAA